MAGRWAYLAQMAVAVVTTGTMTGIAAQAEAQASFPSHHSFMVGGWELNLLHEPDGDVIGFWGIPTEPLGVGNIRRLWFEALPNNDWAVYAYEPKDANAKALELYNNGMSDESLLFFRSRERVAQAEDPNYLTDGGTTGVVEKGFIAGDPLAQTAGALPDPTPMIDLLADVNYPVAPGMTEMLVQGTTGSSVNMSPATKQALTCLAFSPSIECAECICDETITSTPSPWTIVQTILPSGSLLCEYSRTITHTYWQEGQYPSDCEECTIGTPDDPAVLEEIEEHTVIWMGPGNCPDDMVFD